MDNVINFQPGALIFDTCAKYKLIDKGHCYSLDVPLQTMTDHIAAGGTFVTYREYRAQYMAVLEKLVYESKRAADLEEWKSAICGALFFILLLFSLALVIQR